MQQNEDFLNDIEEYFKSIGIVMFDRANKKLDINDDYLKIPNDITNLSPYELGEYLNAFTQQRIYLRTIQSRGEIQEELAKRRYDEVYDKQYAEFIESPKKYSEKAKDKLINMREDVRPLYYEYRDWNKKLSYLEKCIKSLEEGIFLFSREITRRGMDYTYENRNI